MNILNKILRKIKRQHLTLWGVVLLLLASGNINAQKGFSFTGGLGIYELANVEVWNSKPDFIQTDNADFKDYITAPK